MTNVQCQMSNECPPAAGFIKIITPSFVIFNLSFEIAPEVLNG